MSEETKKTAHAAEAAQPPAAAPAATAEQAAPAQEPAAEDAAAVAYNHLRLQTISSAVSSVEYRLI